MNQVDGQSGRECHLANLADLVYLEHLVRLVLQQDPAFPATRFSLHVASGAPHSRDARKFADVERWAAAAKDLPGLSVLDLHLSHLESLYC